MTPLLADTSYLTDSPYGLWGVIMVIVLLGLLCYNAWVNDSEERRRGYYVLAAALVLGLLILFSLHIWQVDPQELFRTIYRKPGLMNRHRSYNTLFFLALGWVAVSWGIGYVLDKLIHRAAPEDEEEDDEA
jgi:predicted membrane channel-forming protein YqfA (hemolysin III family)